MADKREGLPPPCKKSKSGYPHFQQIRRQLLNHKGILCKALKQLNSDWATFCFVKIQNCNADQSCNFSGASCKTVRNFQASEDDASFQRVVWIPDLFDLALVESFLDDRIDDFENKILDKQLAAFEKLAAFLDNISGTYDILDEHLEEGQWASVVGIHILRKLAVYNNMKIDSDYSNLPQNLECPCGCKTAISIGDNSMGHKEVWHGTVDILLGPVAVAAVEEETSEESNSAFEFKQERSNIDNAMNQLIPESIIFASALQSGAVPLVGISKEDFKVFMYDPCEDLLYESSTMPLFALQCKGRRLNIASLVTLWLVINHYQFFMGVKPSHVEFGYKSDLKKFLGEHQVDIYQHHIRMGGLRHVESKSPEYIAGMDMEGLGRF